MDDNNNEFQTTTVTEHQEYYDCNVTVSQNPFNMIELESLKMFELAKRRGFSIEDGTEINEHVNGFIQNILSLHGGKNHTEKFTYC